MTIWRHNPTPEQTAYREFERTISVFIDQQNKRIEGVPAENSAALDCIFCRAKMRSYFEDTGGGLPLYPGDRNFRGILFCWSCGWWTHMEKTFSDQKGELGDDAQAISKVRIHHSSLIDFDISNDDAPLIEARRYITARFDSRNFLHPRLFERIVEDIYRQLGFQTELTSYHGDGGVDVILRGSGNSRIAVQVKRSKNLIQVEQIRSFLGALILNGYVQGVYVSTSGYTKGAKLAARLTNPFRRLAPSIQPIKLVDAPRLFSQLRLTNTSPYESFDQWLSEGHTLIGGYEGFSSFEMGSWA